MVEATLTAGDVLILLHDRNKETPVVILDQRIEGTSFCGLVFDRLSRRGAFARETYTIERFKWKDAPIPKDRLDGMVNTLSGRDLTNAVSWLKVGLGRPVRQILVPQGFILYPTI